MLAAHVKTTHTCHNHKSRDGIQSDALESSFAVGNQLEQTLSSPLPIHHHHHLLLPPVQESSTSSWRGTGGERHNCSTSQHRSPQGHPHQASMIANCTRGCNFLVNPRGTNDGSHSGLVPSSASLPVSSALLRPNSPSPAAPLDVVVSGLLLRVSHRRKGRSGWRSDRKISDEEMSKRSSEHRGRMAGSKRYERLQGGIQG
eukprot:767548-Hanusia_phi.AAC.8